MLDGGMTASSAAVPPWATLAPATAAGVLLGLLFFGGLWWTIRRAMAPGPAPAARPALWFAGSLVLRLGVALGGFYLVAGGHLDRLLACLLGFFVARWIVGRWTRESGGSTRENGADAAREAGHAPQPR
jgi:F1F0 ATPase subunit 2